MLWWRASPFAGPESEGPEPKTAATGRRKAQYLVSDASFGAPTSQNSGPQGGGGFWRGIDLLRYCGEGLSHTNLQ